jgi:hypothetical protein
MMSDVPNRESTVSPIVLADENHKSSVTGATNVHYTGNTNNDNHELALFPSYFICPITQQPPVRGVTLTFQNMVCSLDVLKFLSILQFTDTLQFRECTMLGDMLATL